MKSSHEEKLKVAVLRGGPSSHYSTSLATGEHVLSLLRSKPDIYEPLDIFISKDGSWHFSGVTHDPEWLLKHSDIVFNALHGEYGEDGQVQSVLEKYGKPFTGSDMNTALDAMDKERMKRKFKRNGINIPKSALLTKHDFNEESLQYIFRNYTQPVTVRPSIGPMPEGLRLVHTYSELEAAVREAFNHAPQVIVEEFIRGKSASCSVVENARGEDLYALMPVELHKNGPLSPGTFSTEQNKDIEDMSKLAHELLGLHHYSYSDFRISPSGNIYLIDTGISPKFAKDSPLVESLKAVGWKPIDFVEHLLKLAWERE